uniref:Uncharacterized protein n=1 Tax=Psilocybe cubensis TaxID=181762 RepID=A0A8H8CPY7_PSICU
MPAGTFVSISSSTGTISLPKTALVADLGVSVSLSPGFDDTITLTVFRGPNDLIDTYAWLSLQAGILTTQDVNPGAIPISKFFLLGALNVVFNDEATTNFKHACPAANQNRELTNLINAQNKAETVQADTTIIQNTNVTGSATGWWFRDAMGDGNVFPRTFNFSHSPDIQPVGTAPRSDAQQILGGANANVDWSDANNVSIQQGAPNYIYLRGNCTSGNNYSVQTRLFCVPSALVLYPPTYSQFSVTDFDSDNNPVVAVRNITSTSTNSFNVVDTAFDLLNPQPPPPGSDHFCLIAEARHPTPENPDPQWPHEVTGSYSSASGFSTWIGSTPTVTWRNVSYQPGGAQIICTSIVTIPPGLYSTSTEWILEAEAQNAPVGSAWRLTGNGPTIPGVDIGFQETTITAPNMVQGCQFTGVPDPYTFSAVL